MENRQNKPPKGGAASGHGGQKFHTDSEQAKLHKSKLRMESREERLNKARERLAKQKPPKKPGPIKADRPDRRTRNPRFSARKSVSGGARQCRCGGRSFCGAFRRGRAALWAAQGTQGHPGAPGQSCRPCGVPVHQGHGGLPFPQVCAGAAGGAERRRPVMAPPQAETGVSAQGAGNRQADRQGRRTNRVGHGAVCPGSGGVRQSGIPWGRCLRWAVCWWC